MKYQVLETIRLKTPKGETELRLGQVIDLRSDVAIRLINKGKINPIGKVAYEIHSKILDDNLWIVPTDKGLQELIDAGVNEVAYTQEEINKLMTNNVSKEGLVAIHKVKKAFLAATVEDIESEKEKVSLDF